jgi:hypothetical protein
MAGNPAVHVGDQQLLGTGASGADRYHHQGVDARQVIAAIGSGATSGGRSGSSSGSGGGRKGGSR